MSGSACNTTRGMPRGPFPPPTANYTEPTHCVFPANANTTSIFSSCITNLNSSSPVPTLEPFTDADQPGCEFVYANVTNTTGIVSCWLENNRGVGAGCYGSGRGSISPVGDGNGSAATRVEIGKIGVLMMAIWIVVGVVTGEI